MKMKVLITGAKGQLGKAFIQIFYNKNIEYVPTDRPELDIGDLNKIRAFLDGQNFTDIINCAAYNAVDKAEEEWQKAFVVNGLGVRNLAICANECGCELIHYSSDYVFSGEKNSYTIADR